MTATARPAVPPPAGPPVGSVTAVVGLLVLFEVVSGFLQAGIAPMLPGIGRELGVSDSALTWVISVQLLGAAVCVPAFGRLGDLYGHRRMLRIALVSVAVGAVLVAAAPNFAVLLLGRALQGPLAALLPLEIALVSDRLPVAMARRAIARLVGALTLGSLLGALGMGLADEALGDVRAALWVPAALALVCVPVSFVAVPESVRRGGGRVDWPGVSLLSLTMIALLAGVSGAERGGWLSAGTLGPLALGALLLAAWVVVELRSAEPLVDLRAMAGRHVAPFYATSFAFGIVYFGSQSPNATFLATDPAEGYGFGMSALSIALVTLPATVAAMLASTLLPRVAARTGYRRALVGSFALVAAGFGGFAAFHGALWPLVVSLLLAGVGLGASLSAMPTVIVEASDPSRTGVAAALYNNVKTLGGAVAGGVFGSLLSGIGGQGGYVAVWLAGAAGALVAAGCAMIARRQETGATV
ncbi:MFS transporter [Actinomadura kijaniata]|uniref:MFS family permease n=1 Tax=Actinomadura namibiensis TaxID=182080 RepID=A0A7W3QQW7_ACTNM|nr:MFS transporter [Actinomadura namibiensis]MBA8955753.1 MFS family permease [Actinomadura namibiensis]